MPFRRLLLCLACLCTHTVSAQFQEDFSDGDFTQDPTWTRETGEFTVTDDFQLRLDNDEAGTSELITVSTLADSAEWEFYVRLAFNPSTNNFVRVYLMADRENLDGADTDGYYIRIGDVGTTDAIDLYAQTNGVSERILRTFPGAMANRPEVRVRVTLERDSVWTIFADTLGGRDFVRGGSVIKLNQDRSEYFGIQCVYTVSNADDFYFDDFVARPIEVDTTPPALDTVRAVGSRTLRVAFSEPLDP
ncbi:MAG: hypothetical protein WBA12_03525, partial [Catalinimonas sp.]